MIDFQSCRDEKITFADLVAGLTLDDLRASTGEMIDATLALISGCVDADVTFEPLDPEAEDPWAATPEEVYMAWTLGHVIVHNTASSEESAAIAAELARGVAYHGRSRVEVHWTEMHAIADCRHRLEESRRMRLASLEMWPDLPHLQNGYQVWADAPPVNAVGRFVLGLMHEQGHLAQIGEIVRQAQAARAGSSQR